MRLEKITGFISYAFPLGEADQIISCFSSSGNMVKFIAKGSRKVKSRFSASVQLFNLGQYVIYHGRGLPILRQGDIIDSFMPIRRDWVKSGAAFFVLDMIRWLIAEEARELEAFKLVFAYLVHLKENPYSPWAFDAFRLQLATAVGYEMNFSGCSICGRSLDAGGSINWAAGGAVCRRCISEVRGKETDPVLFEALRYLQTCQFTTADRGTGQRSACAEAADSLIFWLTEGKTKAQAFRKFFEEGGSPGS